MAELRFTADSPKPHDAPHNAAGDAPRKWLTPDAAHRGLVTDPTQVVKQIDRYFGAILERDRAIPLSRYGASFRALSRGTIDARAHHATLSECLPTVTVRTDDTGKRHLAPQWLAIDPGLATELRFQARMAETAARFPVAMPTDRNGNPAIVPSPRYAGARNGRKVVGKGRPLDRVRPTFYLPRQSTVADIVSADTMANRRAPAMVGPIRDASTDVDGNSVRSLTSDELDAISSASTLARGVTLGVSSIVALAACCARLGLAGGALDNVFSALGHSNRRKLAKLLRGGKH